MATQSFSSPYKWKRWNYGKGFKRTKRILGKLRTILNTIFPEIQCDRAKMYPLIPLAPGNKCTLNFLINSVYNIQDKYYLTNRVADENYFTIKGHLSIKNFSPFVFYSCKQKSFNQQQNSFLNLNLTYSGLSGNLNLQIWQSETDKRFLSNQEQRENIPESLRN